MSKEERFTTEWAAEYECGCRDTGLGRIHAGLTCGRHDAKIACGGILVTERGTERLAEALRNVLMAIEPAPVAAYHDAYETLRQCGLPTGHEVIPTEGG